MASHNYSPLRFLSVCDSSIYFEGFDEDAFRMAQSEGCVYIKNGEQKFLTVRSTCPDGSFQVVDLDSVERQRPDCMFYVQNYLDSSQVRGRSGKPVILYVQKDGKKLLVYCVNDSEVCAQEMDLPRNINDSGHNALFYRTHVCGDMYTFESTNYKTRFLGFTNNTENHPTMYKLVLLPWSGQHVNTDCNILQPQVERKKKM